MDGAPAVTCDQPLAPCTTLGLGGPAEFFCQVRSQHELVAACRWAQDAGVPVTVLAGGSNVVVADGGVPGLVIHLAWQGLEIRKHPDQVTVIAAAGTPWDQVVRLSVEEGWAGIECLSGIPGTTGATPVQNVGAYGQEVGERILWVEVLHRQRLTLHRLLAEDCGFAYRTSAFRGKTPWIITRVAFVLLPGGQATVRYPELARFLGHPAAPPPLAQVREAVLELRRHKGMVLPPQDPAHRSVGSFFKNPVLNREAWEKLTERLWERGVLGYPQTPPHFAAASGVKLPAAWLVERAGFARGTRRGAVGVSPHHALALVHWGGGTSAELVAFAAEIQRAVQDTFGITLEPEPVFLGFGAEIPLERAFTL